MDLNQGNGPFEGLNIQSADMEEEEDLEEQRKRKEELHNLLTVAMDDFKYDDQSTINSSTNISFDETSKLEAEKYKNAALDEQLKVLYEVRVREVESLKNMVEEMRKHQAEENATNARKLLLSEAERVKAQTSLKECQDLLAEKAEKISELQKEVAVANEIINQQTDHITELEQEKEINKVVIDELHQKVNLMEQGVFMKNQNEEELRKSYQNRVDHLENLLETGNKRAQALEEKVNNLKRENLSIMQQFKRMADEKEICQGKCDDLQFIVDTLETKRSKLKEKCNVFKEQMTETAQQLKHTLEANDHLQKTLFMKDEAILDLARRNEAPTNQTVSKIDSSTQVTSQAISKTDSSVQASLDTDLETKLKSCVNDANQQIVDLQDKISQLEMQLGKERAQIHALNNKWLETERNLELAKMSNTKENTDELNSVSSGSSICVTSEGSQLQKAIIEKELELKTAFGEIEALKKPKPMISRGINTDSQTPVSKDTVGTDTNDMEESYINGLQKIIQHQNEMITQLKNRIVQDRDALGDEFDKWSKRIAVIENEKETMATALIQLQNETARQQTCENQHLARIDEMTNNIKDLKNGLRSMLKYKEKNEKKISSLRKELIMERKRKVIVIDRLAQMKETYDQQLKIVYETFDY